MGHGSTAPLLDGETGLSSVEGLDLTFFINGQHQGPLRRVEIQPHHVGQLLDEARIVADLEGPRQVRLEAVGLPHAPHHRLVDAQRRRQRASAPVRGVGRPLLRGHLDDRQRPYEYVETLQRRGYRLVQRVELHKKPESALAQGLAQEPGPSLRLWKIVAAILAVGFIAIAAFTWVPTVPVRSIAVMPFQNLSGAESDQYLVSGFKEELVQTLHNIPNFTVKNGRVSYDKETSEIAKLLNVESVLFGSVHRDDDRLIIR